VLHQLRGYTREYSRGYSRSDTYGLIRSTGCSKIATQKKTFYRNLAASRLGRDKLPNTW
jgi:hypothetical protein